MLDLTLRLRAAADHLDTHGWSRGTEHAADGAVCLFGAIRHCAPPTGDEHLIRGVLRHRDRGEAWNDRPGRSAFEVTNLLRTATITADDLAATFGPQWEAIVALTHRTATLTDEDTRRLAEARVAAGDAPRDAARSLPADGAHLLAAARDAVRAAVVPILGAAWIAAGETAQAIAARHHQGHDQFTADAYCALTGPWATAIGPAHPHDHPTRVSR